MHQASDKAERGAIAREKVGMRDRRVPRTGGWLKPPPQDVESRNMTRRGTGSTWLSDRFVRWGPSIDRLVVLKDGAAIEVPASAEEVWDFIEDPRSTPVLQGDPRAFSFPIPGTPDRRGRAVMQLRSWAPRWPGRHRERGGRGGPRPSAGDPGRLRHDAGHRCHRGDADRTGQVSTPPRVRDAGPAP